MYFPLFLNIAEVKFLVVGGGNIALSKVEAILEFADAAQILVVGAKIASQHKLLFDEFGVRVIEGRYQRQHLQGIAVVVAATDDAALNSEVAGDAREAGVLVNVVDNPAISDFIFGANVRRGDLVVSVGTKGVAPVLARVVKREIQAFLPEKLADLSEFLLKNRDLARLKLPNLQARRLFLQEVIEGAIGQEVLSGNDVLAQEKFELSLAKRDNFEKAAVYFIGAGPGDVELMTLKAVRMLSKADVVLYDRLAPREALGFARKDALKINVGKKRGDHRFEQSEINAMLRKYALEGKVVARLKGGDATIFARLDEEIAAIADLGVPYQVVPGVTAASASGAALGEALTSRDGARSVRFLTLYNDDLGDEGYFSELANSGDKLVFYMSSRNLAAIAKALVKGGKDISTPVRVVEKASMKGERVFRSSLGGVEGDFAGVGFASPSLVVVG